jgi:hypothetical protein
MVNKTGTVKGESAICQAVVVGFLGYNAMWTFDTYCFHMGLKLGSKMTMIKIITQQNTDQNHNMV